MRAFLRRRAAQTWRLPKATCGLLIVGAGHSGLAAALYGASEGLDLLLPLAYSSGGETGSTSRIYNYLAFPAGFSGNDLAGRAYTQAENRSPLRWPLARPPYLLETSLPGIFPAGAVRGGNRRIGRRLNSHLFRSSVLSG